MIKAILLAAGQSNRIKSENKLIKLFKKVPLIHHSLKALHKSKISKVIVVLGHQHKEVKKIIKKNKKNIFIYNRNFRKGMASSIKVGLRKITRSDKGFIIVQSDMPFIKTVDINKIFNSIKLKNIVVFSADQQQIVIIPKINYEFNLYNFFLNKAMMRNAKLTINETTIYIKRFSDGKWNLSYLKNRFK